MRVETLELDGPKIFIPEVHDDARGSFLESYRKDRYGLPEFVQDNISYSKRGVLRGLHYQIAPFAQGKLVIPIDGEILDIIVDVRTSSPTFGKHLTVVLSRENYKQLWVPPGFAHGFIVRSESAIVQYKCTAFYDPGSERSILWNDPELAIDWGTTNPVLSDRDKRNPPFKQTEGF